MEPESYFRARSQRRAGSEATLALRRGWLRANSLALPGRAKMQMYFLLRIGILHLNGLRLSTPGYARRRLKEVYAFRLAHGGLLFPVSPQDQQQSY